MNLSAITLFDDNYKQLIMNISIEVAKFEPEPNFEKTPNDIKYNHLKSIASAARNLIDITLLGDNLEQPSMNIRIEVAEFEPKPTLKQLLTRSKIII